jgi:segregation and condensation protein A
MTTGGGASTEYHVTLPAFEGPLDLLLHLIQKHELNIVDIPVAFITEKYLEYLELMKELSIDVASEYLLMAATLAHIKSRSLLPTPPPEEADELAGEEIDPRAELVRRLLEYQKYKQAAADLGERGVLGRDVFLRGVPSPDAGGPAPLAPATLFSLMDAFAKVLARAKVEIEHEVSFDRMSIAERIQELSARLNGSARIRFEDLIGEGRHRSDLVLTFLALLEMTRLKMTRVLQVDPLSDIYIELTAPNAAEGGEGDAGEGDAGGGEPSADQGPQGQEQP